MTRFDDARRAAARVSWTAVVKATRDGTEVDVVGLPAALTTAEGTVVLRPVERRTASPSPAGTGGATWAQLVGRLLTWLGGVLLALGVVALLTGQSELLVIVIVLMTGGCALTAGLTTTRLTDARFTLPEAVTTELVSVSEVAATPDGPVTPDDVIAVAVEAQARITSSTAWATDLLDDHAVRIDPAAEAVEIVRAARQADDLRASLGTRIPDTESSHARLDLALDGLVRRTERLLGYQDAVQTLSRELERIELIGQAEAHDDEIAALLARVQGGQAASGDDLDLLTADARSSADAVRTALDELRPLVEGGTLRP